MSSDCLPEPPYYAVIFSARRTEDDEGYETMMARMEELARQAPGFLGYESTRGEDGFGITVCYWESDEAIRNWKANAEHLAAQTRGRETWYENYVVRIAKVERAYGMNEMTIN